MRLSNSSSNALENYLFGIILLLERVGDYYVIITVKIVPCSDKNPPTHTHIHTHTATQQVNQSSELQLSIISFLTERTWPSSNSFHQFQGWIIVFVGLNTRHHAEKRMAERAEPQIEMIKSIFSFFISLSRWNKNTGVSVPNQMASSNKSINQNGFHFKTPPFIWFIFLPKKIINLNEILPNLKIAQLSNFPLTRMKESRGCRDRLL